MAAAKACLVAENAVSMTLDYSTIFAFLFPLAKRGCMIAAAFGTKIVIKNLSYPRTPVIPLLSWVQEFQKGFSLVTWWPWKLIGAIPGMVAYDLVSISL